MDLQLLVQHLNQPPADGGSEWSSPPPQLWMDESERRRTASVEAVHVTCFLPCSFSESNKNNNPRFEIHHLLLKLSNKPSALNPDGTWSAALQRLSQDQNLEVRPAKAGRTGVDKCSG